MGDKKIDSLKEKHMQFAKSTNNRVWDLLEKAGRSDADDQEMLLTAYASLYHWMNAGTAVNTQRGFWMLSRVYQVLNQGEAALEWAIKCQEITENNLAEMIDFDLAFAREALARAYAMLNNLEKANENYSLAADLGKKIEDPEDQQIFLKNFDSGDWYHFSPE
ncbi:MAG TPA: hypothetical protein ENF22_03145 [Chloroflexi bacterium]|nr:hypothetical protein [Chloroflexota bacterium]